MIALLEPIFQGDWAQYGETLVCAARPPARDLHVADLLCDPRLLAGVLRRHARHLGAEDLRPVASAWSLSYLWALLPPVVAAASVLQHGFPVAPEQMSVTLNDDGEPVCFYIPDEGAPLAGTDTVTRYGPLLRQHLQPLFIELSRQTRLATKILWGNAARYLEPILEQALLSGPAPEITQDLDQLLRQRTWPDGRANPLFIRQREVVRLEGGKPATLKLHRQCCLYHLLPDEGYCGACPLAPEHRTIRGEERGA